MQPQGGNSCTAERRSALPESLPTFEPRAGLRRLRGGVLPGFPALPRGRVQHVTSLPSLPNTAARSWLLMVGVSAGR